ncbi:MAG: phosphotransferase [Bacteroidetes bacterium]|nr:phosphotransferase [Bacteroidota bacterium]
MKYQDKIATSRLKRTLKFIGTGAKVGGNYLKHYAKKSLNPELSVEKLHEENAEDIYNTLSNLKGSALKVAQMLSMDRTVLPKAYADKFTMAQYQAPPLSAPLVKQTFKKILGKNPSEIFDSFDLNACNAASIGQVHKAMKDGKTLAVKVQYPGVAESIRTDLKLVKPIALRMFNISEKELRVYMEEVEEKLLEETDYSLELQRSSAISKACAHLPNLIFAEYFPEWSGSRILTMEWLHGRHLDEFLKSNPSQENRNLAGQALWEFYSYQMHTLKAVHADPHPGNFLFQEDGKVAVLDFGCIKEIPPDFYNNYFALILPGIHSDEKKITRIMENLEMILPGDSEQTRQTILKMFTKMMQLLAKPFSEESFNFGDDAYLNSIYVLGEEIAKNPIIRRAGDGRGSRHMLYINRTYFGLYNLLHLLNAKVKTGIRKEWLEAIGE